VAGAGNDFVVELPGIPGGAVSVENLHALRRSMHVAVGTLGGGIAEDIPGGVTDEGMPGGGNGGGLGTKGFATGSRTSPPPEHANAQCEQRLRTSASPNAKC
jgi:hypothetical protein